MLNARGGSLSRKDVVMPIDLIYEEIERVDILTTSLGHCTQADPTRKALGSAVTLRKTQDVRQLSQ